MSKILGFIFAFFILLAVTPSTFAQQKSLTLSSNAKNSITTLAKDILVNGVNPSITDVKVQLDSEDYATVKNIGLLPDSPWYFFKSIGRDIRLFFTLDQTGKTYQLLKDGNEKTLEALLVTEKAANEKDTTKQDQLVAAATNTLDSAGEDLDVVAATVYRLKRTDTIQAYLLQQEAFQFTGYYIKHQILLQKQQARLDEKDFLLVESARIKHLSSVAYIVAGENRDPIILGEQLAQLLTPQVGSNNTQLATIAVLRDLENNANTTDIPQLQSAQSVLQKEFEIKLLKLQKAERLKRIERYISFIHSNPIREFQAYNFLSKSFTSQEMNLLTQVLKDKSAQDFKKHLSALETKTIQQQFVKTLFSSYPIDMRLLLYTEIQLTNDKDSEDEGRAKQARLQLERLQSVKSLLEIQICQIYGKDPQLLTQTRFYTEATTNPSLLDVRIGKFITQSFKNCNSKTPEALALATDLQTTIADSFAKEANTEFFTTLPTKAYAEELLKEENITVAIQDEQRVAEKIIEERQQIGEEISENLTVLEKEILTIVDKITIHPEETVTEQTQTIIQKEEAIIEEILQSQEPTIEDVAAKEEQIIEEIIDAAQTGETSPLVEELPKEVQEEIAKETQVPLPTVTPLPTIAPTLAPFVTTAPTVAPTTTVIDTIAPVITSAPTTAVQAATPTPIPTVAVPGI